MTPEAVLMWHSIDGSGSVISTDRALFADQIAALANAPVELTFDDGFANFADEAAPILLRHGLSATVFVVSDRVGGTNDWPGNVPRLPLLDWSDLRDLVKAGFRIGAHSATHRDLRKVPDLATELEESRKNLEDGLGCAVDTFAYPYGAADARVRAAAGACFSQCYGTRLQYRSANDDIAELPRLDTYYLGRRPVLSAETRRYIGLRRGLKQVRAWVSA